MKRTIVIFLSLLFVLSGMPYALAEQVEPSKVFGQLSMSGPSETEVSDDLKKGNNIERSFVYFDTMPSLLMAMNTGRIDGASLPNCVAQYIVAHNNEYETSGHYLQVHFQIGLLEKNDELLKKINEAIERLSEDGTIDALAKQYIDPLEHDSDPAPEAIPTIEGADTIRVVVTGDLPPLDYVTADGKPAGFNVAMLAALSKEIHTNIELVLSDAGARSAMLTSGRADAVFWMRKYIATREDGSVIFTEAEKSDGIALTDVYFQDHCTTLLHK